MKNNILIFTFFLLGFSGIMGIFWYEEMRFLLPTPKPKNFVDKKIGTQIHLSPPNSKETTNKPTLLHFFSAKCPCSRFNATHLRELYEKFGKKINFVAIIEASNTQEAQKSLQKNGLEMDFVLDKEGRIADSCGVYSTPQAVILDKNQKIYYKGNYNITRYCADEKTQFARLALEACIAQKPLPEFSKQILKAYGCSLESDEDN